MPLGDVVGGACHRRPASQNPTPDHFFNGSHFLAVTGGDA